MFEEYKDEIDNSIRNVQDQLKKLPSSDEMMETSEELNSAMSYHDNDSLVQPTPVSRDEEVTIQKDPPVSQVEEKKKPSAEAVLDTVALAIKGSGEYNTVLNNLLAKGIITSENRESLDSSPNARQLGREAEKLVCQKYDEHIKRDFQPVQKFFKGLKW
ncbi:uncharacterized protein O3C94_012550 [Discoglossus pictus]